MNCPVDRIQSPKYITKFEDGFSDDQLIPARSTGSSAVQGYYSLNCIMIADHQKKIRFFTNRHCGSAHDSAIWQESRMKVRLDERFDMANPQFLIGDEGFSCSNTLLTFVRSRQLVSIADPEMMAKTLAFNNALKKARLEIEHTFGILKVRSYFRCLSFN